MQTLRPPFTLPAHPGSLSSASILSTNHLSLSLLPRISYLSLTLKTSTIRNGGGPRTFPGGVSKWQWKRMQAKKAKQLLQARLTREKHIYEMRKRAELKAAVSELERPWEVVKRAPKLFSVPADEQLKVLADRFQKPGGFDMWTENDGPQLFETPDGIPTARFFPKGVVHSVKPYQRVIGDARENSEAGERNKGRNFGRQIRGKLQIGGQSNVKSLNSSDSLDSDDSQEWHFKSFGASSSRSLVVRNRNTHVSKRATDTSRNSMFSNQKAIGGESSELSSYKGLRGRNPVNGSSMYRSKSRNDSGGFMKNGNRARLGSRNDENGKMPSDSRHRRVKRSGSGFGGHSTARRVSDKENAYSMTLQQDGSYSLDRNY